MSFHVYFLRNSLNQLYIGQTNNLVRRKLEQSIVNSKTAKFVRDNREFELIYFEEYSTRPEAMRREKQLKGWTRAKKEALINGNLSLLKAL